MLGNSVINEGQSVFACDLSPWIKASEISSLTVSVGYDLCYLIAVGDLLQVTPAYYDPEMEF